MNNNRSRSRLSQVVLNLAALVVMLVFNVLSTSLPLGGRTPAEISDSFDLRFVPAGYVFSIWGLIYVALVGFAVFQALPGRQDDPLVRATGWTFVVSSLANSLWIVFWHYGYYPLSLVAMLTLLGSLIVAYRRLAAVKGRADTGARWLVGLPFSLYLGWITVATVANAGAVLLDAGWDGRPLSPVAWTVGLIAVAAGLALVMLRHHRDAVYAGVIIWALGGILVAQQAYAPIVVAAALGMGAVAIGLVAMQWRRPTPALEIAK